MDRSTQHGYLVLADISGYTSYVASTELSHAQEILSEMLEVVVGHLTPVLTLWRLQGDAVITYAPESRLSMSSTLLDVIDGTYIAFKDRVEAVRRGTTCTCNACKAIPTLDLKFIVHYGEYHVQSIAGAQELVGNDVNIAFRLLKNDVKEATGWNGYALFSEQALAHTGLDREGMFRCEEEYEHMGRVVTYSLDMNARYKELSAARRVFITPEDADLVQLAELNAPIAVVWEWITDPYKISRWQGQNIKPTLRPGGRNGVGMTNHCSHGKNQTVIQTVLDWKPFDYYTMQSQEVGSSGVTLMTFQVTSLPGGRTRLGTYTKLELPALKKTLYKVVFARVMKTAAASLNTMIAEEENAAGAPGAMPAHAHAH